VPHPYSRRVFFLNRFSPENSRDFHVAEHKDLDDNACCNHGDFLDIVVPRSKLVNAAVACRLPKVIHYSYERTYGVLNQRDKQHQECTRAELIPASIAHKVA